MSDEKPVSLKRKSSAAERENSGLICICHYDNCSETEVRVLADSQYACLLSAIQVRQCQLISGARLDDICLKVPKVFDSCVHGAHRSCFKKFTNVSRYREKVNDGASTSTVGSCISSDAISVLSSPTTASRSSDRKKTSGQSGLLFPQNECLFCHKEFKYSRGSRTKEILVTCQTSCSEDTIRYYAQLKNDFKLLGVIEGENLRAREARYHPSCRKMYTNPSSSCVSCPDIRTHDEDTQSVFDDSMVSADGRTAHAQAFEYLAHYVSQHIIADGQVERMIMLNRKYLEYMQRYYVDYYNPTYPTQRLKAKLVSRFGEQLTFWQPQSRCKSELVFSNMLDVGEAVEVAFNALSSEKSILNRAAEIVRREITVAFETTDDMPWPPSAEMAMDRTPPQCVNDFVSKVTTGKDIIKVTERSAWQLSRTCVMLRQMVSG